MKKVLVPTDFSQNSKHALRYAAELAAAFHADLEILHANTAVAYAPVLPEYYAFDRFDPDEYAEGAADELKLIKRAITDLKNFENLSVETRVESGFLHTALKRVATEDGCDLVVMGTKGASGATEFFVGSNTEKVIRTSPCAVLAVPETSGDFKLKTVVLATTLKADQKAAYRMLADWQKKYHFKVLALYLNNPAGKDTTDEIEAENNKFCKETGLKDCEVFASSNTFNEEMAILRFAKESDADMIAMTTHQRKGISHMLFGSLTEDAANHSEIPVLSVPV